MLGRRERALGGASQVDSQPGGDNDVPEVITETDEQLYHDGLRLLIEPIGMLQISVMSAPTKKRQSLKPLPASCSAETWETRGARGEQASTTDVSFMCLPYLGLQEALPWSQHHACYFFDLGTRCGGLRSIASATSRAAASLSR